jgi:uncharacterized membrane protein YhaH (DUF805 family)
MNFFELLFSFRGRIGRLTWWLMGLVQMVMTLLAAAPIGVTADRWKTLYEAGDPGAAKAGAIFIATVVVAVVLFGWVGLAANVKRFHDRNKSGWWLLVAFVPVIGALWLAAELAFFGPVNDGNRFDTPTGRGFGGGGDGPRLDADDVIAAWRNRAPEPSPVPVRVSSAAQVATSAWGNGHASVVTRSGNPGGGFGRRGRP